jgi:hypothetical protein
MIVCGTVAPSILFPFPCLFPFLPGFSLSVPPVFPLFFTLLVGFWLVHSIISFCFTPLFCIF